MNLVRKSSFFALLFTLVISFFPSSRARADASFGDAAVTVAVSTVAGAVLGASTLPFYEESGEHTKNIFYGAALGAVAGVFISAYAGVKEGPDYEDVHIKPTPDSALAVNDSPKLRLHAETSTAMKKPAAFGGGDTLFWSPVAQVRF